MTTKLYYESAYIKEFDTIGIKQDQDGNGNPYIVLEKTAFYPTGGGQPHDKGTLNGVHVVNVEEIDGEIRHYLERKMDQTNNINGEIDWDRRFDHMQQHCGQHILTAAFVELFQFPTVSFHLGTETSTIDIVTESVSEEILMRAEKRANEIILEDRLIEIKWVTEEEAKAYKLRKDLSVSENIRLVIIPDYDYNGCGGTHPNSTGQVGSLKILGWEKHRSHIRVTFVCGNRVLQQLRQKRDVVLELSRLLSASQEQMTSSVSKLLENNRELSKKVLELQNELLAYEAEKLWREAVDWNGEKVVKAVFRDRSIKQLQTLAKIMTNEKKGVNLFLVAENEGLLQFVFARDSIASINMKEKASRVLSLLNGKGGGSEYSAQGGGQAILSGGELLEKIFES